MATIDIREDREVEINRIVFSDEHHLYFSVDACYFRIENSEDSSESVLIDLDDLANLILALQKYKSIIQDARE